jgi:hypothetical protein
MMAEETERDGNSFIVGGCYGDKMKMKGCSLEVEQRLK